jgi:anti-sigma regulatory factor (Ser/Thr protein kinase)
METLPEPILSLDVPCDPDAPGTVRAALAEMDRIREVLIDVMLVASELVTNAVVHSGCQREHELAVRAYVEGDRMTISVWDPGLSAQVAHRRVGGADSAGGWGLQIVDRVAARWGSERDHGYQVWAELALAPSS